MLLGLCAAAVTTVNDYQDAEQAGNFFTQALDELREGTGGGGNTSGGSDSGTLIVEETQLAPSESDTEAAAAETLPVLSADVAGQEETSVDGGLASDSASAAASDEMESDAGTFSEVSSDSEASIEEQAAPSQQDMQPEQTANEQEAAAEQTANGQEAAAEQTANGQETTAEQTASGGTVSYIVQRGDSLAIICRRQYGNTDRVEEIAALNQLEDPNHLIPGQTILLP